MNDSTQIAIEQAKAEKKSPVILWIANFFWPGLGNLIVGQVGLGIFFGLLEWLCLFVTLATLGLGAIVCVVNWLVASGIGHSQINRAYAERLGQIRS